MKKTFLLTICLVFAINLLSVNAEGKFRIAHFHKKGPIKRYIVADTVKATIMGIVKAVINASGTFDIDKVANLYTPNAVIADEEPPFSWNGLTAGIQWITEVEKTVKMYKLTKFKPQIQPVQVFYASGESVYVVVPVDYTGEIKGDPFEEAGAFTFILRLANGKWLIKSQVWTAKKGM